VPAARADEALAPVRLPKTYFTRGGKTFVPLGAHWVPATAALQWPQEWRASEVEADFRKMQELGFNTVRLDLFWAWFEPRPGDYNPEAFAQFDALVRLAEKYQIYLHPALFIGGEVGDAFWDVPWRNGRHPHGDPEMLRLQTNHAAELARRYKDTTAILAWDLSDEPPYWIARASTNDAMAINWTRLIAGAIRRFDPNHLIAVGTDNQDIAHGPFRPDNIRDEVDFFSVHPYPIYNPALFPDSMLSERITYAGAFQTALSASAGRPAMVQEIGASSAQYAPEIIAQYERANLYSSLAAGANGFLLWCFTDAAPETYAKVPYLRAPYETQFGLVTWDGKERPRAAEFRRFQNVIAKMNLDGVEPAQGDAAILVPDEWAKPSGDFSKFGLRGPSSVPYVASGDPAGEGADTAEGASQLAASWLSTFVCARRAGLKAEFPREYGGWQKFPIAIVPSPVSNGMPNIVHVHTTFWREARKYVEAGGVMYASLSGDSSSPDIEPLFGVRFRDRVPVGDVELRVVAPFGNLKPGETLRYRSPGGAPRYWAAVLEVRGGTVIATDQEGRPALVAYSAGKGKTLVCAYPLEAYLAASPMAFDSKEETHRIYRALWESSAVRPLVSTDQPSVEVSVLRGTARGYAVLVNHSGQAREATVTSSFPVRGAKVVETGRRLEVGDKQWKLTLEPYDGAIVELQQ
jgi:endo-1,4-beta-mannosidase